MADRHPDAAAMAIIVHDRPGALAKIANLFYRRGVNIRMLTVVPTATPALSRMEVELAGPRRDWARVALALDNLVDVVSVEVLQNASI